MGADLADRLAIASWVRLRPIATASTTPASASKRSTVGGRPPVEAPSCLSVTRPRAVSADTRAETAVRERPVTARSSVRVVTIPSRIRANTSPAVAGALFDEPLMTGIFTLKQAEHSFSKSCNDHHFDREKTKVVWKRG